tara:strand:+ start:833 stop:1126 length:294 start_codon:yes stop_codon:yes gene_type:complete
MTLCLLEWLVFYNKVDKIKLINVEIDEITHKWHKLLFPNCVKKLNKNILDIIDSKSNLSDKLFYLNFCGLQGQGPDIIERLHKISYHNASFISFSTR